MYTIHLDDTDQGLAMSYEEPVLKKLRSLCSITVTFCVAFLHVQADKGFNNLFISSSPTGTYNFGMHMLLA